MAELTCVECNADLDVASDVVIGEIVSCIECGLELEVVQNSPFQLQVAPEIEEDWGE